MTTRLYSLLAVLAFTIMLLFALAFSPPATDASVSVSFENVTELIAIGSGSGDFRPDTYKVKRTTNERQQVSNAGKPMSQTVILADYRRHNWRTPVAA